MHRCPPSHFEKLKIFLDESDIHLVTRSVFAGLTPGDVYLDDLIQPRSMFVQSHHRFIFYGSSGNQFFNQSIKEIFKDTIIPSAVRSGQWGFDVYYSSPGWKSIIPDLLEGQKYNYIPRQHWFLKRRGTQPVILPDGIILKMVDPSLVAEDGYEHMDLLQEEMCSECEGVKTFLGRGFGVCAIHHHSLIGWCLSEYNSDGRCEIGIATRPEYQGQGIATAMVHAFSNFAFDQGIQEIGWHCFSRNVASWKTAQKAGLQKCCDYESFLVDLSAADR